MYVFVSITIHIRTLFWKQKFFAWHGLSDGGNGILFPKLFWPTVRKKCSSDVLNFSFCERDRYFCAYNSYYYSDVTKGGHTSCIGF